MAIIKELVFPRSNEDFSKPLRAGEALYASGFKRATACLFAEFSIYPTGMKSLWPIIDFLPLLKVDSASFYAPLSLSGVYP